MRYRKFPYTTPSSDRKYPYKLLLSQQGFSATACSIYPTTNQADSVGIGMHVGLLFKVTVASYELTSRNRALQKWCQCGAR